MSLCWNFIHVWKTTALLTVSEQNSGANIHFIDRSPQNAF